MERLEGHEMAGSGLDLFHFRWAVYKEGYRWMEHSEITSPELNEDEARQAGPALIVPGTVKSHPPTEPWRHGGRRLPFVTPEARYYGLPRGLFMEFARLDPSIDRILKFVQTYGHLGLDKHVGRRSPVR
jgi:hypothetical protein